MNFEELSLKYKEKNIVKLCKKLSKSFALTRSKDMTNLYELAFWLYIYDYKDEILNIYNLHKICKLKFLIAPPWHNSPLFYFFC